MDGQNGWIANSTSELRAICNPIDQKRQDRGTGLRIIVSSNARNVTDIANEYAKKALPSLHLLLHHSSYNSLSSSSHPFLF